MAVAGDVDEVLSAVDSLAEDLKQPRVKKCVKRKILTIGRPFCRALSTAEVVVGGEHTVLVAKAMFRASRRTLADLNLTENYTEVGGCWTSARTALSGCPNTDGCSALFSNIRLAQLQVMELEDKAVVERIEKKMFDAALSIFAGATRILFQASCFRSYRAHSPRSTAGAFVPWPGTITFDNIASRSPPLPPFPPPPRSAGEGFRFAVPSRTSANQMYIEELDRLVRIPPSSASGEACSAAPPPGRSRGVSQRASGGGRKLAGRVAQLRNSPLARRRRPCLGRLRC